MKRSFFQAAVVSILLYGCTTWTLTKQLKKLDGNYTRMLQAILNKSWRQHPTRHQLYGHLPPITKTLLLYGCTTWTLTKQLKKLDGNYTIMLRAILNKSWRQHPTRHQLYGHLLPITKTLQVRRTRHAGHCWRSKDELINHVLLWTPHMAKQKQDDQLEHTYSIYVRIRDVALKTCQRRWMIGRSGERVPGISVQAARHDDDDDQG